MESTWQGDEFGKLFGSWMEVSKNIWQAYAQQDAATQREDTDRKGRPGNGGESSESEHVNESARNDSGQYDNTQYKTYRNWEAAANNFASFLRVMAQPENQKDLTDNLMTFSEVMAQAAGDALENLTELQGQVINSFAKVTEHTKAYNFDDIDHTAFESFRELYRSEFQKYLKMPKIGLPREFHERLSSLADSSTLFYSYLTELLYLFSLPFEKTNRVMQQKVSSMLEKGECDCLKDSKKTYGEWIKTLEANFMELLNSQEYTEVLNKTIVSLAAFKNVRRDVMGVVLKDLQIPTNKEMDEVYRDLYQMKKKIRQLTGQVESLRKELQSSRKETVQCAAG